MSIKERRHRLPIEFYKGKTSVSFILCLKGEIPVSFDNETANAFIDILSSVIEKENCIVPAYCFMPDHQHLIIMGNRSDSDIWKAIVNYKQKTGFWMSVNRSKTKWQKDFYDHVIKNHEDIAVQIRYILDNPVRKGLVQSWEEYPFKGAIGCKLEDVLNGIV
jgi:putative transposase